MTISLLTWISLAYSANKNLLFAVFGLTALTAVGSLASVYMVGQVVDLAGGSGGSYVWALLTLASALIGIPVVVTISSALADALDDSVKAFTQGDLLQIITSIPDIAYHEDPNIANMVGVVERDLNRLAGVYRLTSLVSSIASVIVLTSLLCSVSPLLILIIVFTIIPGYLLSRGLAQRNRLWREGDENRRLADKLVEILVQPRHALELRCFNLIHALGTLASQLLISSRRSWVEATWRTAVVVSFGWLTLGFGFVGTGVWVVREVQLGSISPGNGAVVLYGVAQVAGITRSISNYLTHLQLAAGTIKSYRWLKTYSELQKTKAGLLRPPRRLREAIIFDQVSFSHADQSPVIDRLSFCIPAGSVVALVGANGSGKSTLLKLLCKLYEPTSGRIMIDGLPLQDINHKLWRERIISLFQNFARLEFILRSSIAVGDWRRSDEQEVIDRASFLSGVDNVAKRLPHGYQTPIGRRLPTSVDLSGVEWQKVAIARTFMRNHPLLAIYDEPGSGLDIKKEEVFHARQKVRAREDSKLSGCVTIFVSHRLSLMREVDTILVMANGRLVEQGTHGALIESGGLYAEMFRLETNLYK